MRYQTLRRQRWFEFLPIFSFLGACYWGHACACMCDLFFPASLAFFLQGRLPVGLWYTSAPPSSAAAKAAQHKHQQQSCLPHLISAVMVCLHDPLPQPNPCTEYDSNCLSIPTISDIRSPEICASQSNQQIHGSAEQGNMSPCTEPRLKLILCRQLDLQETGGKCDVS